MLTGIVLLLGCLHLSEHIELYTSNLFAIKWTNYISNKTGSCKTTVSLYTFCTQNDKPHRFLQERACYLAVESTSLSPWQPSQCMKDVTWPTS